MLPMPLSPSASWAVYRARLAHAFEGADTRVMIAFWFFGLINNVLYVLILSAALDLVGPSVPKGLVLLADVIPSFFMKLTAPYYIHTIPYPTRVFIFAALSALGMLLIALTPQTHEAGPIAWKMLGIVLASVSSGAGELSFLGLTHFYGKFSLAAWGSGTGGAGLVGAGAYALATNTLGLTVRTTTLVSAFLPIIMLASFFMVLPLEPLDLGGREGGYRQVRSDEEEEAEAEASLQAESEGLLSSSAHSTSARSFASKTSSPSSAWQAFMHNLRRARSLFFPYMLPLLLVYIAEYTINQGVAPTLLFPLPSSPFSSYRAFYPMYAFIYQLGVFISRSSIPFFRIHNLYAPSFLQVANLILLTAHALFNFLPSVWLVFLVIFWEGLLGGLVYVNTFAEISDKVDARDREFSLGATTVSDSAGICVAGFVSMAVEVGLCKWQVSRGRDWCTKT